MIVGELLEIRKEIFGKKKFFLRKNNKNHDHNVMGIHIFTICHFIPYVIIYISVKLISPNNIPFCVHLSSELISIGDLYHITHHIDLRHGYNETIVIAAALFVLQLFLTYSCNSSYC